MEKNSIIPNKIPDEILKSSNYDRYNVLILYALALYGPLKREKFINTGQITNRINKNTFHKYANSLLKKQLIISYYVGRNSKYQITPKGEGELLRRLVNYSIDFRTLNRLEQNRLEKYIKRIINFFNDFKIEDNEIKVEFLDLVNKITHDKLKETFPSERKFNKLLLYIVLNHPRFYNKYNTSIEDFIEKLYENDKAIEDNITKADILIFIQKIVKENTYDDKIYVINTPELDNSLFFRSSSEFGIFFVTIINFQLKKFYYLNNLGCIESNLETLEQTYEEILSSLVEKYEFFHKDLKSSLYFLIDKYLQEIKEDFTEKVKHAVKEYSKVFPILNLPNGTIKAYRIKKSKKTLLIPSREITEKRKSELNKAIEEPSVKNENIKILDDLETNGKYNQYIEKINVFIGEDPNEIGYYVRKSRMLCDFIKDYEQALEVVDNGLKINSDEINLYINKAMILLNLNKLDRALDAIEEAIKIDGKNSIVLFKKAYLLTEKEDYLHALKVIDKSIRLNPGYHLLYILKYEILEHLNKFEDAISVIDDVIKLNPKNIILYIDKSRILCDNLKKYKIALEVVNKGLKIDDNEPSLYVNKAMILNNLKRLDEALIAIGKALELEPENDIILSKKAYLLYEKGDYEKGIEFIKKAIEKKVNLYQHYLIYVDLLTEQQNFDECIEILEKVLKINQNDEYAYAHKARMLIEMGDFESALENAEKSLEFNKKYIYALQIKAIALRCLDKFEESLDIIGEAISLDGMELYSYEIKAETLQLIEDDEAALRIIDKLIQSEAENYYYYIMKSRTLARMEKFQDSLDVLTRAIELNPTETLSYKIKAEIYGILEDYSKAIDVLKQAISLDQKDFYLYKMVAYCLLQLNKYEDALKAINKSIVLFPNDHDSFIIQEECLFELKHYEEALEAIENAIISSKEELDLNTKARILAKLKRKEEAVGIIQELIKSDSENELYYDTYGEILMWSKEFESAIEKYKKAIELLENKTDIDPDENFSYETFIKMGKCYVEIKNPEAALKHLQRGKKIAEEKNKHFWVKKATHYLKKLEEYTP